MTAVYSNCRVHIMTLYTRFALSPSDLPIIRLTHNTQGAALTKHSQNTHETLTHKTLTQTPIHVQSILYCMPIINVNVIIYFGCFVILGAPRPSPVANQRANGSASALTWPLTRHLNV